MAADQLGRVEAGHTCAAHLHARSRRILPRIGYVVCRLSQRRQGRVPPGQPIYCAAPIFDGVADPVKQRSGGFRGEREHVAVPADLAARVKQREEREIETGWQQGSPIDLAEIEKMIEVIPPPEDYETIKRVAAALGDANVPDDPDMSERLELFTDWNSRGRVRDHDGEDRHFERLFRDMARPAPAGTEPTRVGTLIKIAQLNGYELPPPNPAEQFGTADTFDAYLPEPYILDSPRHPKWRRRLSPTGRRWTRERCHSPN